MILPLMCMIALLLSSAIASAADKPNILLIMADDQGYGDAAYTGHPLLKTPNLDAMAKAGLRFDRFYAAAPVCSPTRGSVMTGRHPNRFGCFKWGNTLRPQEVTIAKVLKKAGYGTAHFGKWHLGSVRIGDPVNPGASGFDHWLSAPNFYDNDPILSREGKAVQLHGESSMIAADAAIEFMQQQVESDKPFFTVVWFGSPHLPHQAVEQDKQHYDKDDKRRDWLGEITGLDRAVGKLRAYLRDHKLAENTLVWYCSDNGGLFTDSTGGREKKGSIYEGGLRVPAVIEWTGRIKPGRVITQPAVTSDIYPTLVALTGATVEHQPPLDGVNLMPLIDGADHVERGPLGFWDYASKGIITPAAKLMAELLAAQKAGDENGDDKYLRTEAGDLSKQYPLDSLPGHAAWLDWPWKLHRIEKGGKVRFELYDLAGDPMEKHDRASDQPQRVASMKSALENWQRQVVRSLNGEDYGK
jgi:arylsulfatase A-like enzyme